MPIDARELLESADLDELRARCEPQVARWEWADFERHSLEPAYFEINKVRRGELLATEPDPPISGSRGHGFDTRDQLVWVRQQVEFPGRYYETFYVRSHGGVARYHFHHRPDKAPINAAWLEVDPGGRVLSVDTAYARGNRIIARYQYQEDRVVGVERTGTNPPYGDLHDFRDIDYAGDQIVRVWWREDGNRVLDYERPDPERTLAAAADKLRVGLVDAIAASLADRPGPVVAIALYWCGAEYRHRLPPGIAVCTAAEHTALSERFAGESDSIWNPAEWREHLRIGLGDELASLCASVNQDIWQGALQGEADVLIRRIAADLGERSLSLQATDDFVVFATNLDLYCAASDVAAARG